MEAIEPVIDHIKRRLREVGAARWGAIAEASGVAKSLPRKLAYGDRENPGIQTIQPLLTFFRDLDAGRVSLPDTEQGANHG